MEKALSSLRRAINSKDIHCEATFTNFKERLRQELYNQIFHVLVEIAKRFGCLCYKIIDYNPRSKNLLPQALKTRVLLITKVGLTPPVVSSPVPTASIKNIKEVFLLPTALCRIKRSADPTQYRKLQALNQLPRISPRHMSVNYSPRLIIEVIRETNRHQQLPSL